MVRTVKKPEERRMEILEAARFLFQTKGFENTSMQEIIDRLGIAKGTIYYYFKSKEELLEAVIDNIIDESVIRMQKNIDASDGNALDKLRRLVAAGKISEENDEILEHLHKPGNAGLHCRLLAVAIIKQSPLYAKLFQQGCEEGIFQTDTPQETAEFILTAIQFLTDVGIYPWTQETMLRRAKAIPSLLETVLRAQPGSFRFLSPQNSEEESDL